MTSPIDLLTRLKARLEEWKSQNDHAHRNGWSFWLEDKNFDELLGLLTDLAEAVRQGDHQPGTMAARFQCFLDELHKRYPDPEPYSARAYEGRLLSWLDALEQRVQVLEAEREKLREFIRTAAYEFAGDAKAARLLLAAPVEGTTPLTDQS